MPSEVTINGQDFLIGKLTARQQLNIVKRLAPVLQGLMPIWALLQRRAGGAGTGDQELDEISETELGVHAAAAIANTIHMLSDEASDYVLDLCLGVVRFRSPNGGGWAPLRANNGSGQVMLESADDLAIQMRLLWEVLYANLRNFSLETLLPPTLMPAGNLPTVLSS